MSDRQGNQLFIEFKGALTENYVAQAFVSRNHDSLYYWTSEGTAEVDFIVQSDHDILPLEVKAGVSSKKKSLLSYTKQYHPAMVSRSTLMNLKHDGNIFNYPLYMINRFPMKYSENK